MPEAHVDARWIDRQRVACTLQIQSRPETRGANAQLADYCLTKIETESGDLKLDSAVIGPRCLGYLDRRRIRLRVVGCLCTVVQ